MSANGIDRAEIDRIAARINGMYRNRPEPRPSVTRGTVQAVGDYTYDVLMPDGAVLLGVKRTVGAAGASVGSECLIEWIAGIAYVTGVVASADSSHYVTSPDRPLRVWTGSYAPVANDTSVRLWTLEDFASHFGSYETGRTFIGVMNGDGDAIQVHVEGATKTNAGIYAVFDNAVNGSVRIDWLVVN